MKSRRPRFTSPMSSARDAVLRVLQAPLSLLSPTLQFAIGFSFLVGITSLLLFRPSTAPTFEAYNEGDVVRSNIVAPADILAGVDAAETARRQNLARDAVRPIFRFDSKQAEASARSFREAWESLKTQAAGGNQGQGQLSWPGGNGDDQVVAALVAHAFNSRDLDTVTGIIRETVDGYIASFPSEVGARLEQVRKAVLSRVPGAEESISYRIPTVKVDGKYLVYFAAWKHHIAMYPIPELPDGLEQEVRKYRAAKGTLRFPFGEPTPYRLIESIAETLMENRRASDMVPARRTFE